MREYVVRVARYGEILIRAKSAEEAALMVNRFDFDSAVWDDGFELSVEVAQNPKGQDGRCVQGVNEKIIKGGKKRKAKKRNVFSMDYEIPF